MTIGGLLPEAWMEREQIALDQLVKTFAWVLLAAAILPVATFGQEPLWPWESLQDASPIEVAVTLLPLFGAAVLFLLARWRWHRAATAAALLSGCLLAWLLVVMAGGIPYSLQSFHGLTEGLPPLFSRAFWLLLLGIVVMAAGSRVGSGSLLPPDQNRLPTLDPWNVSRWMIFAGFSLVCLFYVLPWRGTFPLAYLMQSLGRQSVSRLSASGVGALASVLLTLAPLGFALLLCRRGWRRTQNRGGMIMTASLAYLPGLCLMAGLRAFSTHPAYTLVHLRSALLVFALLVIGSVSLAALVRCCWFEVPWMFGQLGSWDVGLIEALSKEDGSQAVSRHLGSLHPWLRPFFRRRLRLWMAACGCASMTPEDFKRLGGMLRQRMMEESPVEGMATKAASPWWASAVKFSWVQDVVLLLLLILLLLATGPKQGPLNFVTRGEDRPEWARVFGSAVPAVVLEQAARPDPLEQLPSYPLLVQTLQQTNDLWPGLRQGVLDVLLLGQKGHYRWRRTLRAMDQLNRLLQQYGIPYYLRGQIRPRDPDGDLVAPLCYQVMLCKQYRLTGSKQNFEVLLLSRAGDQKFKEPYLGAADGEATFVSILLDRLDDFIYKELLPRADRQDAIGRAIRSGALEFGGMGNLGDGVDGPLGEFLQEGLIRHELHHRWIGLEPQPPVELWMWMDGYSEEAVRAVTSELGAFLGELSYRANYARLRIAIMLDSLSLESEYEGSYGMASRFLFKRLFGVEADSIADWKRWGGAKVVGSLDSWSDAELEKQIDRCHRELFGADAPRFVPVTDAPAKTRDGI